MRTLLALTLIFVAGTAFGEPSVLRKKGECKLPVTMRAFIDGKEEGKVELTNDDIEVSCQFYGGKVFKKFTLVGNPEVKNKSGKELSFQYQAAFFDKEGELVAFVEHSADLDAGETPVSFGSAICHLPQVEFEKIVSYKIVIYVERVKPKRSDE